MRRALILLTLAGCRIDFDEIPAGGDGGASVMLSIVVDGDGTGTVVSVPAGISCPGTCEALMPVGQVSIVATPSTTSFFGGWSQPGCASASCAFELAAPQAITARFTGARNVIFVTSLLQPVGAFGGVAAADTLCSNLAAQNGLPGTYVALLSTSTASAVSRLGSARGWIRSDGFPVADTAADLFAGRHFYPPDLDETGRRIDDFVNAVTGTTSTGTASANTCTDYTVTASGNATSSAVHGGGATFMSSGLVPCSSAAPIYCAGTSYQVPVSPLAQTGRVVFATPFSPGGGLADADVTCNAAAAGKLGGTFVALLATQTASAQSRLISTSGGWVRPDGVTVATTSNDFTNGRLLAPISRRADGTVGPTTAVWSGATSFDVAGTGPSTCTDWTDMTINESGVIGFTTADRHFFSTSSAISCNQGVYIYCIEP